MLTYVSRETNNIIKRYNTKQNKLTSSDTIFTLKDATNTMQVKYGNTVVSSSLILSTQDGIGLDVNFDTINSTSTKAVMSKTIYNYLTTNYAEKSNYVAKADVEDHFDVRFYRDDYLDYNSDCSYEDYSN